ncbi:hypothetical protein MUN77_01625 [Leucobacter allii]|uniref:hypothetical protein n=1 Tax=Leucobacter allii TaxID=2932247 RepID=UPI001FD0B247|nr:hypothetical protein [Leucobacter allii]UOR02059.1 hypothetical protein MUN77_01625 [Leucobacter allii]
MIRFGGDPQWIGWDAAADAAAATHDVLVSIAHGLGGSKPPPSDFYKRPGASRTEAADASGELFAPSIAEFNVGAFMSLINGG